MLKPASDRLDYGDLLIPPLGFETDFALGTTYSLDLEALVGFSLALFLSAEMNNSLLNNSIVVLESLRRSAKHFAVLCEGGQIKVPQNRGVLLSFLEDSVYEVVLSGNRSFHPKVWLIRYQNGKSDFRYRLLVMSRNQTFDRSWDVAVALEGELTAKKNYQAIRQKNKPLLAFVKYLQSRILNEEKQERIAGILKELARVEFTTGDPHYTDYTFYPLGIPRYFHKLKDLFPVYQDLLIISPFISKGVIDQFAGLALPNSTGTLITRRTEINKLVQEQLETFDLYVMKEMVVEGEEGISGEESGIETYQNQDIHAKCYALSQGSRHQFFIGSANCTGSAFGGNVEFLIQLEYRQYGFKMQNLLDDLFGKNENENPFEQIKELPEIDLPDKSVEDVLERVIKDLCRTESKATVIKKGNYYQTIIEFAQLPSGVKLTIAPITGIRPVELAAVTILPNLSVWELGEFYRVSAILKDKILQRIIKIKTIGIPIERDKEIFRSIIKDPDTFIRYIAFLLPGNMLLSILEQMEGQRFGKGQGDIGQLGTPVLYENMLKAITMSPECLDEIGKVMELIDDEEIIPSEFTGLYEIFSRVAKKVKNG